MNRWQYAGAPDAHAGQEPQLAKLTPTRSPGATLVTPSPTSTTTPAPSCPSTPGSGKGSAPSRVARSVWQMPTALICTRTSPGLGASSWTFSRPKSPPTSRRTAAVTSIRNSPSVQARIVPGLHLAQRLYTAHGHPDECESALWRKPNSECFVAHHPVGRFPSPSRETRPCRRSGQAPLLQGMPRPASPRVHGRACELTGPDGLVQAPYLPRKTFGDGNDAASKGVRVGALSAAELTGRISDGPKTRVPYPPFG